MKRGYWAVPVVVAAGAVGLLTAAPASAAPPTQIHRDSISGASAYGAYAHDALGHMIRGSVHDTKADGQCAEVWLDFKTESVIGHEHHDAYMVYACGHGKKGWGPVYRVSDANGKKIGGMRMAVCRAKSAASKPTGCKIWNDSGEGSPSWPVLSHRAGTYHAYPARNI